MSTLPRIDAIKKGNVKNARALLKGYDKALTRLMRKIGTIKEEEVYLSVAMIINSKCIDRPLDEVMQILNAIVLGDKNHEHA